MYHQIITFIFKKIFIVFICLELVSLILLVTFRLYNLSFLKIKNSEPLTVYFSKKHLPHPIFRQPVTKDHNKEIFDPNTVFGSVMGSAFIFAWFGVLIIGIFIRQKLKKK